MLPSPLHPAVVHFPIVLMLLLPLGALGGLWAIRKGTPPFRAWAGPVALAIALTVSAWAAVETGESQEEQVERRVSEQALQAHEESAERFLVLSGIVLAISTVGLARGVVGRIARPVATIAAVALVAVGYAVGHSGGQLVYGPNGLAAGAPATAAGPARGAGSPVRTERSEDD